MMNDRSSLSRTFGVLSRLILLAILIMALAPAWPAGAQEPDAAALARGDVAARQLIPQVKKVFADDGGAFDAFGGSIAVSGDIMVVGAPSADADDPEQGAAYVFGRNVGGPGNWGLIKRLTASDGSASDRFGMAVAIDGSTIVVGAPFAYMGSYGGDAGAAYVFERDAGGDGAWGQTAKLEAIFTADIFVDDFGWSVAIHGSTVVVGARLSTVVGQGGAAGAVYLFGRNQGGAGHWGQVKTLVASDGQPQAMLGQAVGIYGSTIVAGAPGANGYGGVAYLFGRDAGGAGNWGQVKKLVASDAAPEAFFGSAAAIGANTVVIGASSADVNGHNCQGSAYVFERDLGGVGNWGQAKELLAGDGAADAYFGVSVAISGPTVVVGAAFPEGPAPGAAYTFSRDAGGSDEWGQIFQATGETSIEAFGAGVGIDAATIVIGAPYAFGRRTDAPPGAPLAGSSDGVYVRSGAAYIYTPYALRVNSGGPRYIDTAGNLWVADRSWLPGVPITPGTTPWGYTSGLGRSSPAPISNTEDDKLYQTERLYFGSARPGYKFVVPNGRYMITFKYAEIYWNAPGMRRFNVTAQNKICFTNYDVFIAAGGARNSAAPDKVCVVDVTNGMLEINFISLISQAKADAIYIQQLYR